MTSIVSIVYLVPSAYYTVVLVVLRALNFFIKSLSFELRVVGTFPWDKLMYYFYTKTLLDVLTINNTRYFLSTPSVNNGGAKVHTPL